MAIPTYQLALLQRLATGGDIVAQVLLKLIGSDYETGTVLTPEQIKSKWLYASTKPTIHMEADLEGLDSVADLGVGALDADCATRANVLKAAWNHHIAGVGTATVDGEHKATDAANTINTIDATDLTSAETLGAAILTSIIAHGNQSGVHFLNDTGSGGTGASVPNAWNSLAHTIANLNSLKATMLTHMAAASF